MSYIHVYLICSPDVCECRVYTIEVPKCVYSVNAENRTIRKIVIYKSSIVNFKCLIKVVTNYLA